MVTLGSQNTACGCCHTLGVAAHQRREVGTVLGLGHQVGSQ